MEKLAQAISSKRVFVKQNDTRILNEVIILSIKSFHIDVMDFRFINVNFFKIKDQRLRIS